MRGHDTVAVTAHRESAKVADRPISITEWHQRIIGLHGELHDTTKSLEEKVATRRAAASQLLLGIGGSPAEVEKLEAEGRIREYQSDALRSAVEYGEAEIRPQVAVGQPSSTSSNHPAKDTLVNELPVWPRP